MLATMSSQHMLVADNAEVDGLAGLPMVGAGSNDSVSHPLGRAANGPVAVVPG